MSDEALSPFDRLQHTFRQLTRTERPAPDAQPTPNPHDTPDHGDGHAGDTASDSVSDPALLAPTDSLAMPSTSGVSQSPPSHPTAHVPLAAQPIEQPSSASVSDPASAGNASAATFPIDRGSAPPYEPYIPPPVSRIPESVAETFTAALAACRRRIANASMGVPAMESVAPALLPHGPSDLENAVSLPAHVADPLLASTCAPPPSSCAVVTHYNPASDYDMANASAMALSEATAPVAPPAFDAADQSSLTADPSASTARPFPVISRPSAPAAPSSVSSAAVSASVHAADGRPLRYPTSYPVPSSSAPFGYTKLGPRPEAPATVRASQ